MTFEPFRTMRFDVGAIDLAAVTAPPYDAIDADEQRRLYDLDPHNIVRLELGMRQPDHPADNRYTRAADQVRTWLDEGILVVEDSAALWLYEEVFDHAGERRHQRGLIGALDVTPWEARQVLPHERVFREHVEDRKALLREVPVNLSPVFLLAPEDTWLTPVIDVLDDEPTSSFTDREGIDHRLWRISDRGTHREVTAALERHSLLMADGHHRYTTALEHHTEVGGRGSDATLAYIVPDAHGPVVRPMHRLIRRVPDQLVGRLRTAGFSFHPFDGDVAALLDVVSTFEERCFGLVWGAGTNLVRVRDPDAADRVFPKGAPGLVRRLDVALLQATITGPLGVRDRIEDLLYTPDAEAAAAAVAAGLADALLLAKAPSVADVRRTAAAGHLLPPKSTSFHPKPRTGLVMRPLDADAPSGNR